MKNVDEMRQDYVLSSDIANAAPKTHMCAHSQSRRFNSVKTSKAFYASKMEFENKDNKGLERASTPVEKTHTTKTVSMIANKTIIQIKITLCCLFVFCATYYLIAQDTAHE